MPKNADSTIYMYKISIKVCPNERENSVYSDKGPHYELPHLDLHCLQFFFLFHILHFLKSVKNYPEVH